MSNYCAIIPTIKVGDKEVESKLFQDLSKAFKDRNTVKTIWAFTKTSLFQKSFIKSKIFYFWDIYLIFT